MKMSYLSVILAILLVFGFIGCDEENGDNNNQTYIPKMVTFISTDVENNRYTLMITENTSSNRTAYSPKSGDAFVLTVELFNDGNYTISLTCSGTVQDSSATALNLQLSFNNQPLSITINNGNMTVISGTIISDDGEESITIDETKPLIPDSKGDESANAYLGETLIISEQVYYKDNNGTVKPFTGNLSIQEFRDIKSTANITNGKLNINIGTPSPLSPIAEVIEIGSWHQNYQFSVSGVQAAELYDGKIANNSSGFSWLERRRDSYEPTDDVFEHISYIYVDKDVTVSAKGKIEIETDEGIEYKTTSSDISLVLKKGWNTVFFKMDFAVETDVIVTESVKNPSNILWMLY